ncbi:MAG: CarD family transcriptional regulator [Roseburia sp.]
MFEVGDYIVYGNNGVCQVTEIGYLDKSMVREKKLYYTLVPCYSSGNKIFTPVDNEKVIMRPVLTKQEADELIRRIPEIDSLWIADEKRRETIYKEAFRTCDCTELVRIIKTIWLHKKDRQAEGKKTTTVDDRYFQMAESNLYGELAFSLDMEKDQVRKYIIDTVEEN